MGDWVSGSAATHPGIYRVQAIYGEGTRLVIAHRDGTEEMVAALPFNRTDWRWWFGGPCPVDPLAQVEIQTSDSPGTTMTGRANSLRWSGPDDKPAGNITAYRPKP